MARIELIMPKMGESVSEATIITWLKEVGEMVELDETIVEIATDKVDSEVPSTHEGKLVEKLFKVDVIKVNIINKKARKKITRGRKVKVSGYKKAIITLKKGQSIDLTTGI